MEERKFATDEERVQLAKDVLQQLDAGNICGVPPANWYIGFPMVDAVPYFNSMHLDIDDFNDAAISRYDGEDEFDPKEGTDHWVIGSRGQVNGGHGQPDSMWGIDLQELLTKLPNCEVCAVGSLVVAAARRHDNMKIGELEDLGVFKALAPYFEHSQLLLIETAYERSSMNSRFDLTSLQVHAVANMWDDVPTGSARLRLIMENIVTNNGQFVVPELLTT